MRLSATLAVLCLLGACSTASRPGATRVVTITATDYAFAAPDTIPAARAP